MERPKEARSLENEAGVARANGAPRFAEHVPPAYQRSDHSQKGAIEEARNQLEAPIVQAVLVEFQEARADRLR